MGTQVKPRLPRPGVDDASFNSAGFGYYYGAATGENYRVQHFAKV